MAEYFVGRSRENMDTNKRNFLTAMIPVALGMPFALVSDGRLLNAEMQRPTPPQGSGGPPIHDPMSNDTPAPKPKDLLKQNQQQIHDDVEKLYKLATELKDEVEKTDATNTLSLPMIQKAEQIEKLAKQVKNLTRGG
jgi:hypothetical protein